MEFNSLAYLVFLPVVALAFHFLKDYPGSWFFILVASCYFYVWYVPYYLLILAALILVDYLAALAIERLDGTPRWIALLGSIGCTVGILAYFKIGNASDSNTLIPLGLSFHTFQSLSYVIEVYRRRQPAERNLAYYSLYVMFFPQLAAGPIERPQNLMGQFRKPNPLTAEKIWSALALLARGFFKKLVLADGLAVFVDSAFSLEKASNPLLGVVAFSVQLYCDFSGYTDIARGSARLLGIELVENFARPLSAQNIVDYWRQWHISLTSWFRDYVYIPLGGSRVSSSRWTVNVLLTFLLSGLWHGLGLNFLIWGLGHGLAYVITCRISFPKAPVFLRISLCFLLVSIIHVFFRAPDLNSAFGVLRHLISPAIYSAEYKGFLFWLGSLCSLAIFRLMEEKIDSSDSLKIYFFGTSLLFLVFLLRLNLETSGQRTFIYFGF